MTAEGAPDPEQQKKIEGMIASLKAVLAEVEQMYDSVTDQLVEELKKMANLDATSKPAELREASNRLRALEVRSLDLQLQVDKLEMRTEESRALLQSVAAKEVQDLIAVVNRRAAYFARVEARQSEFFHRLAETISLAYGQLKESNDREFHNRIAKYGAWIAAAVAVLSAASILIEIIKFALRGPS
jgi:hypothetical protein